MIWTHLMEIDVVVLLRKSLELFHAHLESLFNGLQVFLTKVNTETKLINRIAAEMGPGLSLHAKTRKPVCQ